jgi:hypothetical protein
MRWHGVLIVWLFTPPAVVANGLAHFHDEWLLYYGAADRRIGLAVYRPVDDPSASR